MNFPRFWFREVLSSDSGAKLGNALYVRGQFGVVADVAAAVRQKLERTDGESSERSVSWVVELWLAQDTEHPLDPNADALTTIPPEYGHAPNIPGAKQLRCRRVPVPRALGRAMKQAPTTVRARGDEVVIRASSELPSAGDRTPCSSPLPVMPTYARPPSKLKTRLTMDVYTEAVGDAVVGKYLGTARIALHIASPEDAEATMESARQECFLCAANALGLDAVDAAQTIHVQKLLFLDASFDEFVTLSTPDALLELSGKAVRIQCHITDSRSTGVAAVAGQLSEDLEPSPDAPLSALHSSDGSVPSSEDDDASHRPAQRKAALAVRSTVTRPANSVTPVPPPFSDRPHHSRSPVRPKSAAASAEVACQKCNESAQLLDKVREELRAVRRTALEDLSRVRSETAALRDQRLDLEQKLAETQKALIASHQEALVLKKTSQEAQASLQRSRVAVEQLADAKREAGLWKTACEAANRELEDAQQEAQEQINLLELQLVEKSETHKHREETERLQAELRHAEEHLGEVTQELIDEKRRAVAAERSALENEAAARAAMTAGEAVRQDLQARLELEMEQHREAKRKAVALRRRLATQPTLAECEQCFASRAEIDKRDEVIAAMLERSRTASARGNLTDIGLQTDEGSPPAATPPNKSVATVAVMTEDDERLRYKKLRTTLLENKRDSESMQFQARAMAEEGHYRHLIHVEERGELVDLTCALLRLGQPSPQRSTNVSVTETETHPNKEHSQTLEIPIQLQQSAMLQVPRTTAKALEVTSAEDTDDSGTGPQDGRRPSPRRKTAAPGTLLAANAISERTTDATARISPLPNFDAPSETSSSDDHTDTESSTTFEKPEAHAAVAPEDHFSVSSDEPEDDLLERTAASMVRHPSWQDALAASRREALLQQVAEHRAIDLTAPNAPGSNDADSSASEFSSLEDDLDAAADSSGSLSKPMADALEVQEVAARREVSTEEHDARFELTVQWRAVMVVVATYRKAFRDLQASEASARTKIATERADTLPQLRMPADRQEQSAVSGVNRPPERTGSLHGQSPRHTHSDVRHVPSQIRDRVSQRFTEAAVRSGVLQFSSAGSSEQSSRLATPR